MTQHELTFSRAVAMTTAAIAAGQLNYADHEAVEKAILQFYDILFAAEFPDNVSKLILSADLI